MKENSHNHKRKDHRHHSFHGKNAYNILPSSKVLESYETIAPGSVSKLIEMAKKEQEHRQSWQDKYLKSHESSYKAGQIFGFVYNILFLVLIYKLIIDGNKALALKLFIINAVLIFLALIVTFVERKVITRKPPRRGHERRPEQNRNQNSSQNPNQNRSRPERGHHTHSHNRERSEARS